jgi:hypothetical protein
MILLHAEEHFNVFVGSQALQHASIACSRKLVPEWVAATDLEERAKIEVSKKCHCRFLIVLLKLEFPGTSVKFEMFQMIKVRCST